MLALYTVQMCNWYVTDEYKENYIYTTPYQIKDHQLHLNKAVIAVNFPFRMGVIPFQHPSYS